MAKQIVMDDRMSDDEIRELTRLLKRRSELELDQFDWWRIETNRGPIFVHI